MLDGVNGKKKKQGGTAASTKEDEFASQFERKMSLPVSNKYVYS